MQTHPQSRGKKRKDKPAFRRLQFPSVLVANISDNYKKKKRERRADPCYNNKENKINAGGETLWSEGGGEEEIFW